MRSHRDGIEETKPGERMPDCWYRVRYAVASPWTYDLRTPQHEIMEPGSFVLPIQGTIEYAHASSTAEGEAIRVGRIEAHRFRTFEADDWEFSPIDLLDGVSERCAEIGKKLFKRNGDATALGATFFSEKEIELRDLLVIDAVELVEEHRGRGAGLMAVWDLISAFAEPCGPVVAIPAPEDKKADMRSWKAACRRIGDHFGHLGFRWIGRTRMIGLSLCRENPGPDGALKAYQQARSRAEEERRTRQRRTP